MFAHGAATCGKDGGRGPLLICWLVLQRFPFCNKGVDYSRCKNDESGEGVGEHGYKESLSENEIFTTVEFPEGDVDWGTV
ncbi:MAG: hypothetical protein OEM02_07610 [Desulfobulbaceae bacterium]|nr:hypothetical protein [Desulfobulbaceae bacterium]